MMVINVLILAAIISFVVSFIFYLSLKKYLLSWLDDFYIQSQKDTKRHLDDLAKSFRKNR